MPKKVLSMFEYMKAAAEMAGVDISQIEVDIGGTSFTIKEDPNAPSIPSSSKPTRRDLRPKWARTLGIRDWQNATAETVKKHHRTLTLKHHPDRGGSQQKQAQLNSALQSALADLECC